METKELLLKTAFCCMACDGIIASEEISLLKKHTQESGLFEGMNVEEIINGYVTTINERGMAFLSSLLNDIDTANLSTEDELQIVKLSIEMIEADKQIEYSEIAFFKRVRLKLKISDDTILDALPDKEYYLLPDIVEDDDKIWDIKFNNISLADIH